MRSSGGINGKNLVYGYTVPTFIRYQGGAAFCAEPGTLHEQGVLVIRDASRVGNLSSYGFQGHFLTGFSGNHGQCDFRASLTQLVKIRKGKIVYFDDPSGHFRPSSKSMDKVAAALRKLYNKNHNLFSDEFNWRKQ